MLLVRTSTASTNTMAVLRLFLVSLCLSFHGTVGSLRPQPSVRWQHRLVGADGLSGRGLRKGNEVVAHKGGHLIFVTADDGSLHILDSRSLENKSVVFEPVSATGTSTECRSGVSQVEDKEGKTQYLVYAVIDTPVVSGVEVRNGELQANLGVQVSSRVLGVNLDGTLRWSLPLEGIISGTPLVGTNGTIYVSHNVETESFGGRSDSRIGYVSVVLVNDDGVPEVTASLSDAGNAPFGPPSLVSVPQGEGGPGEISFETADYVAVAESWNYGYSAEGGVHLLMPSEQYDVLNGKGTDSYKLILAAFWPYSTVTRPTLSPTGESLWMNGYSSTIGGWTENRGLSNVISGRDDEVFPRWTVTFQASERNASQPILSAAVVSEDESLLYFAGASYDLFCVDATNGREVWTDFTARSVHVMEPKLSEIDGSSVVYIIEQLNGNVRQHDATKGTRNWQFSCADLTGIDSCQDAVEAEFSLAPSGNVLYYGDIFGNIVALEVADYATDPPTGTPTGLPSESPTVSPTATPYPTSLLTPSPTRTPIVAVFPTRDEISNSGAVNEAAVDADNNDETASNLVPILIGAAVGAVCAVVLVLFMIVRGRNGSKKDAMVIEEADDHPDLEGATGDDGSVLSVERIGGATVYSAQATRKRKKKRTPPPPATPQTLASIDEDREEGSPACSASAEVDRSGQGVVRNLNDKFSYAVEVQTDGGESEVLEPESSQGDDDEVESNYVDESTNQTGEAKVSEHGLVGTANGGSHLELSVGNNTDFRPLNALAAAQPLMDLNDSSSHSSASSVRTDEKDMEENPSEEEKKEDESVPSPQPSHYSAAESLSPVSSTSSSVYLDDGSVQTKESVSQPPRLPPVSPKTPNSLSGDADVPEDERVSLKLSLAQPKLAHRATNEIERSVGDSLAAPGSHYMTQGALGGKNGSGKKDRPWAVEPESPGSKFGKSVRPKGGRTMPRFLSSKGRGKPTGYQGYESSDSDASWDNRRDKNGKPTFKRASRSNSKVEEQQHQAEPKRDDSWTEFLQELEEAEKQFFGPSHKSSSSGLSQSDDDSDIRRSPHT